MTKFRFEGDLKEISEKQLNFIASVLEDHGYTNETVTIEPVGQAGDNYLANVKRIAVEKDGKVFKMVAKVAPTQELLRTTMNSTQSFINENYMYTTVLPKFSELEVAANIPKNERLRYAECYGSLMEEPYEIILLEDLKMSDFIMFDRLGSLTDESVKLTLRSFAIYHTLSYALKHQAPDTFEEFASKLVNALECMAGREDMVFHIGNLETQVLSILDNDRHKNLVKGSLSGLLPLVLKNFRNNRQSAFCVIQQGDPWTNNIMFRVEDGKPIECCMIDYQQSNKNSPVADLEYMIFNCTDYKTRSKHYHEWIDYYHTELDKRLANFGLQANVVYPRGQLDADLCSHGKLYLGISIMVAIAMMREAKDAAVFKESIDKELSLDEMMDAMAISNMEAASVKRFKDKVEGLINSMAELGYIVPEDQEL